MGTICGVGRQVSGVSCQLPLGGRASASHLFQSLIDQLIYPQPDTSLPQQLITTAPPWAFIPDASFLSTLPALAPISSVTPEDPLYIAPPGLSESAPNPTQPPTASFSTSTFRIQDVPSASSHTSATGPAVSDRTARPSTNSLDRSSTLPPRLRRDNLAQTRDPVMNASSSTSHPGAASVRSLPGHDHRQDTTSEPFPPYNARFDRLDDGMRMLQLLIAASCVAQGRQWSIFVPELFNRLSSLTRQIRALEVAATGEQANSGGS
ncbi:hypothetical protein PENSPDRAFT_504041 [Peniophora sp. CONT]|nr:hypothetical protein PENSPDRAFT_504041 [Peniophora sp. CONT]